MARIYLSPPHMGGLEQQFVEQAFASNFIAPCGPMVDAFEQEFAEHTGFKYALAVSSGTAAAHLALRHRLDCLGSEVGGGGSEGGRTGSRPIVYASTLTFIGSVTPARFEGCELRFVDCDRESWNMDPELLAQELERCAKEGERPAAVIPTDLYGQCCNLPRIVAICNQYDVPVICDSAEAVGSRYFGSPASEQPVPSSGLHAGRDAWAAVYSFNGNKIITSSGGGMLASDDEELIRHARKLATQARDPAPHYQHSEIGFNYRMSNLVAAVGRGQLRVLEQRVAQKRAVFDHYRQKLENLPGIAMMPEVQYNRSNRWLTVLTVDPKQFAATSKDLREALEAENIEARPVWKPMHLQPVFAACRSVGGGVAGKLFENGLCLPSGTALTENDLARICEIVRRQRR